MQFLHRLNYLLVYKFINLFIFKNKNKNQINKKIYIFFSFVYLDLPVNFLTLNVGSTSAEEPYTEQSYQEHETYDNV